MEWVNNRHDIRHRTVNVPVNFDANVNPIITIYALYLPYLSWKISSTNRRYPLNDEELKQVVEALQELLDALEDATTKLSELPSFQAAIREVREEQARRLLDSW